MSLSRRNLFQDKTRLALSVGGVALAVMLILVLNGFLDGLNRQITLYLDRSPGSIIVAQDGVNNLLGATSLLPSGIEYKVDSLRGVEDVAPILSQFVILDLHDKKQPAYLVGYEPGKGGGPWEISSGRQPKRDREVVFDRILAGGNRMRTTDIFKLMGESYTIVGLSK